MLKKIVLPADTYVVVNKTILSDQDRKLLSMLYQPIIGSVATNLYFSLWSNLDRSEIISTEYTHHYLMANMQLNLDEIIEARERLEGIGLLKVFLQEGNINRYIYELFSPVSAYEFFNNPILNTAFYSNVGKEEYDKIVSYFEIPRLNTRNYEEITCSFHEIFYSCALTPIENKNNIKRLNRLGLNFVPKIDLNNILSMIPEEMLNLKGITRETREFLYKISYIYDLDDEEFGSIIRNSINERHLIDKKMIRENCRKYYSFENSGKLPSLVFRNQPEYLRKPVGDVSKRAKTIYNFETLSPYDFLTYKNNNAKPSKIDLSILEMLLIDYNLNPGVVNVLIDYVLKINNNKLVKNFVEVIASQWKRSKIETVEEAMKIAEKEFRAKAKVTAGRSKQKRVLEEKPEWFNKNIEIKEVSEEEEIAFKERLKNIK